MFLQVNFISGLMFGIEYLWDDNILVIDLGIVRVYIGSMNKLRKNKNKHD